MIPPLPWCQQWQRERGGRRASWQSGTTKRTKWGWRKGGFLHVCQWRREGNSFLFQVYFFPCALKPVVPTPIYPALIPGCKYRPNRAFHYLFFYLVQV
jgi:hypothetical protein